MDARFFQRDQATLEGENSWLLANYYLCMCSCRDKDVIEPYAVVYLSGVLGPGSISSLAGKARVHSKNQTEAD